MASGWRPLARKEKNELTMRTMKKSGEFAEKRKPRRPGEPGPYNGRIQEERADSVRERPTKAKAAPSSSDQEPRSPRKRMPRIVAETGSR